jgi:hypothetical protein
MKRSMLLTFAALLLALSPAAFGADCTLASATGSWSYGYSGSIYDTQSKTFVPAALTGMITFDGKGNATGGDSISVAGKTTDENFSGTYTENADCSGTFTLTSQQSGQTVTGKFVPANGDNEAYLILTSAGITMNGTTKKVKYHGR